VLPPALSTEPVRCLISPELKRLTALEAFEDHKNADYFSGMSKSERMQVVERNTPASYTIKITQTKAMVDDPSTGKQPPN